jgi:integrase/recombinase XerD
MRNAQQLAGHASMQTTRRYIEGDADAKPRLVHLVSELFSLLNSIA